ncbi:exocyst complex component Sec3-domain-containing protein [Sporodiniella umbellata]|nr:exocyst complex component Sec3-domain-containing protein [Sporodiniella umbellata]
MDGIRQLLITSLYPPGGSEKLIVHVKTYKDIQSSDGSKDIKGTPRYLCLTQKKSSIKLSKVKRNQNGAFSVGRSWSLEEIKQIQIVDAHQFSLTLNKAYLWAVEKGKDKMIFLAFLIDFCNRYASRMPKLVNIDEPRILKFLADPAAPPLTEDSPISPINTIHRSESPMSPMSAIPTTPIMSSTPILSSTPATPVMPNFHTAKPFNSSASVMTSETYDTRLTEDRKAREAKREREKRERQVLVEKERQKKEEEMQDKLAERAFMMNVEELLTDFNWKATGNASVLEGGLLKELHALEDANVHAIIESDDRAKSIVGHIDKSLAELDSMESWLSLYAAELNSMGDDIREIEIQNRALQILNSNQLSLISELDRLLNAISIPKRCLDSLQYDSMDSADDVIRIQESAEMLQKTLKSKLPDGLQDMVAVQERLETYNVYGNRFSERVFKFLKDQFEQQARLYQEQKTRSPAVNRKNQSAPIIVSPHEAVEDQLIKYQGFILWEKEMEPRMYSELQRCYAQAMAPLYERDIRDVIDATRSFYSSLRKRDVDDLEYLFKPEESRQARALAYAPIRTEDLKPHRYRHMLRGSTEGASSTRSSIDEDEKATDEAFAQLLKQSVMLLCREQNYMCDLFESTSTRSFLERGMVYSQVPNKFELYNRRDKIRDVKISKKILSWMEMIFETMEPSIVNLLEYGVKSDPTLTVSMMAAVEYQQEQWEGSDQEFALKLCTSLSQRLTRMFENFINDQVRNIEEKKLSIKKRKGVLSFFRTFPIFAMRLEVAAVHVQPDSGARATVNIAYEKVIQGMMNSLETISKEGDQTGDDKEQLNATIMYIENMHHLYHTLRTNKLHVLDKWSKHAKSLYDSNLKSYVHVIIRRPLGRLLEFFEGVEAHARTTNLPEEVSFHMSYNKAQLRKVIALFPPKEIKKALEQLYRRVDKHFSEEEGLLQVVWRGIQEELIQQHRKMSELIVQCYPGVEAHLEFTIEDLLEMMRDLAKKVNL